MGQRQAFMNDVERPCAEPRCKQPILRGEIAIHEYRRIGRDKIRHIDCDRKKRGKHA